MDMASQKFLDHFTGHSKYKPPTDWDTQVMEDTGKYASVLVTEAGNRRRGKFIFKHGQIEPIIEFYSGQLGGNWSGGYKVNLNSYMFLDGRGAERETLNLGARGEVRNIILDGNHVAFKHLYKTGRWARLRRWHLPLEGV